MLKRWLGKLFRRNRFESDMQVEMRAHIDAYIDDLVAGGVPLREAQRKARLEFGTVEAIKEECREAVGLRWPDEFRRDIRFGLRMLRNSPGFAFTAILTLGLCIGVNTAIFSVVDAVLLRPLPYPEPDRLVTIARQYQHKGIQDDELGQTGYSFELIRDHATSLEAAAYSGTSAGVNLAAGGRVQFVRQERVSTNLFHVLGVRPIAGREFTAEEDRHGGPAAAILTEHLWRSVFNADRDVVGKTVLLRGEPDTVVGIMPDVYLENSPVDLWTPLQPSRNGEGSGENYGIVARLRPGVTWPQAQAQVDVVSRPVTREYERDGNGPVRLHLIPLEGESTAEMRTSLLIVWAAVAVVLLIGCVNIAGLLLARGAGRGREIATRLALGSNRAAIVRQMLAEGLLLAVFGGAVGIAFGYAGIAVLRSVMRHDLEWVIPMALDARVLCVSAAVALTTSILFGLFPAWQASRLDIRSGLIANGGRAVAGSSRQWPRRALVIAEVALGFALLMGAGLLIRSFAFLQSLRPGFDAHNVITGSMSLQDARYQSGESVNRLFDEGIRRMHEIPGVEAAAVSLAVPYERALNSSLQVPAKNGWESHMSTFTYVTPEYLSALKIPLLRGRWFTAADNTAARDVAVINDVIAQRYFKDQDPVGKHLREGGDGLEIIGVVGTVPHQGSLSASGPIAPMPMVYIPAAQQGGKFFAVVHTWFSPSWIVRYQGSQRDVIQGMQSALQSVDPQLPFASFRTLADVRAQSLAMQRFQSGLLGCIAGLALLLAAIGIYGLIANSVVERRREIAIRIALGATPGDAIRTIARPGLGLAAAGVLIGYPLARATAHLLRHMVWGFNVTDASTFGIVGALLLVVAGLASIVPAFRIARIDPSGTLRSE